jgi:integrase
MSDSTGSKTRRKPEKPYEGFPMFAHPSGQWAKKINKRLHYFGVWADPEAALARLNREYPYLIQGKVPPAVDVSDGCTLRQLCNDFLRSKEEKVKAGDLSPRTFRDYYKTCERLIDHFGKERRVDDLGPSDFRAFRAKLAKRLGIVSLKNEINRVCIVFNYAHENDLIAKPVSYGQNFDRPSAKALRRDRNSAGPKLFERDEVLRIFAAADVHLKAMILLGVNCGFGNTDVASLPKSAVDLETGWVDFPRPKTEIPRRVPLWPETIAALKEALAIRPATTDPSAKGLCFVTRQGRPWVRVKPKAKPTDQTAGNADQEPGPEISVAIDAISEQFGKLLKSLHINGRRGLGFYTLRHNFETFAGESKDQVAVDAIMGHVDSSMAGNYRHRISDERLLAVVETVRSWLYGKAPDGSTTAESDNNSIQLSDPGASADQPQHDAGDDRPPLRLFAR